MPRAAAQIEPMTMEALYQSSRRPTHVTPPGEGADTSGATVTVHVGYDGGTTYLTPEAIHLMHDVPNTNPRVFGEAVWRYMEAVILGLPDGHIPQETRDKLYEWLLLTGEYLPCGKCSEDFGRRVGGHRNCRGKTLTECTEDKTDLLLWIVETQMDVKRGMGKPACSYQAHYEAIARLGTALPLKDKANIPRKLNLCTPYEVASQNRDAETPDDLYNIFSFLCAPSPAQFGPFAWAYMVLMLVGAPDEMTEKECVAYRSLLSLTAELLPCCACASQAAYLFEESFREHQPRSRGEFLLWVSNVHNRVNAKLGKPQVPAVEAARMYAAITQGQSEVNRACAETCPSALENGFSSADGKALWGNNAKARATADGTKKKKTSDRGGAADKLKVAVAGAGAKGEPAAPRALSNGAVAAICIAVGAIVGVGATLLAVMLLASNRSKARLAAFREREVISLRAPASRDGEFEL